VLTQRGWQVEGRRGHDRGIDIEVQRGSERLVLGAKGEGSLQPMRVNYFIGALGELLQRVDSPVAFYGLALLPNQAQTAACVWPSAKRVARPRHRGIRSGDGARATTGVQSMPSASPQSEVSGAPPAARAPIVPLGMRVCTDCGETKPATGFVPIKACREGYYGR
jgi:hypothetical protein